MIMSCRSGDIHHGTPAPGSPLPGKAKNFPTRPLLAQRTEEFLPGRGAERQHRTSAVSRVPHAYAVTLADFDAFAAG